MQSTNQPWPASQSQPQLHTPPHPKEAEAAPPTPAPTNRPALPDRNVTADSIEEAYVSFILFCNPALALPADTTLLREAFRNPPRSCGKSFSTFAVWELVRRFYDKEIPTWAELTKELGVEPPDPAKDESTQKIAQYGVRLKKWMNSMHVRAFFEYLMDIANDYWTNIPTDPNPIGQPVRDGIAVEDDMALRALVPHIRPKRGRKRPPEDDSTASPAQRTHLSPSSAIDDPRRGASGLQVPTDAFAAPWTPSDVQQMPLTRWPQSAITPTCRGSFWDDALEPRSAVVGSKPRLSAQRRGAKNVSSAWRPGGANSGAKRGRPPMNRTPIDGSFPPFPNTPVVGPGEAGTPVLPTPSKSKPVTPVQRIPSPASSSNSQPQSTPQEGSRPQRPSISLQVPERPTGSVRLATPPPPVVLVNGNTSPASGQAPPRTGQTNGRMDFLEASRQAGTSGEQLGQPQPKQVPGFFFERVEDRTNVEDVVGQLTQATLHADWRDANGQPGHPPSLEEASALVNATVEKLYKTAASPGSFLINLAALAGGALLRTSRTCVTRLRVEAGTATYRSEWEYGFGSLRGLYSMEQQVPVAMFWDPTSGDGGEEEASETGPDGQEEKLSAGEWQAKYRRLLDNVRKKDRELLGMQHAMMKSLRGPLAKE